MRLTMIEENQIKLRIRRIRRELLETNMRSLKLEIARGGSSSYYSIKPEEYRPKFDI